MIVLGIETSCDETAAAVVADGRRILSSVVSSQVAVHRPFGGVVPELASRKHIEAIVPVVRQALSEGGISQAELEAVAVTQGPGLIGSLLVGFSFAKAFAMVRGLPWIGVSHLEGHINSVFLESDPPAFPFTTLLASGGHTSIYHVTSHTQFDLMGQTRDDAAGEAFDKVAKMLGLGYPGGGIISKLAQEGDPTRIPFPRSYLDRSGFDFSFSGLKTAVGRYVRDHFRDLAARIPDIAAGFQEAVVEVLADKVIEAAIYKNCNRIALVGGVAANGRLREKVTVDARKKGISVYLPGHDLCGDNAAMIAAAGYHHLAIGARSDFDDDVYSRQAL
ncbi:MAG: tRNA (adenosine(37)-N6)-threonylcarbamoyltransferase complex transferase subunit TsaD [Desulfobacterales bacterium]|nr:tRNA (adenosine(37)-N6)-threonylcarbamoyltransferase complex transferase subunit TsaD [Desulfobacterales bacterium]